MARATLLRTNRSFRRLWLAELTRYLAAGLRRVAIPWLVLTLTGSPLQLGVAFALETTPDVLAAPLVGQVIDTRSRVQVLVAAALLAGFALAVIPLTGWVVGPTIGVVYAALVALSVFDATYHNAREALLPAVVDESRLDAANAYLSGASSVVGVVFLGVGGALTGLVGPMWTVALAAVVTTTAVPVLLLVEEPTRDTAGVRDWDGPGGYVRTVREGVALVRGTVAQDVILSGIALNVAVAPYTLLVAALAESKFAAPLAYGLLLAAVRIGSVLGNYVAPRVPGSRERRYVVGMTATGVAALAVGAVGTTFAGHSPLVAGGLLALALAAFGLAMPVFNVPSDSLVQLVADDDARGRVVTMTNATLQLGFPVGYLTAGWLVARTSPAVVFALAGAAVLALAGVLAVRFGRVEKQGAVGG